VLGRLATGCISVFWLIMMAVLAHREILPAYRAARQSSTGATYARLEEYAEAGHVSQMGIYLGDRRVGRSVSVFRKVGDEVRLSNDTEVNLELSPAAAAVPAAVNGLHAVMRFRARILEGRLLDFRLTVSSPPKTPPLAIVDGYPTGKVLVLRVRQGDRTTTQTIPFAAEEVLSSNLTPLVALPERLRVGRRWTIRTLDPTTYAVRSVQAEVVAREPVSLDGVTRDAYRIEIPYGSYRVQVWVAPDGEVLKQKFLGFVFLKEQPD